MGYRWDMHIYILSCFVLNLSMWDIYIYIGDTMRIKQYRMFIIYIYVEIYRDRTHIYIHIYTISAIYKCCGLSRLNIVMFVSSANSFADCFVKA